MNPITIRRANERGHVNLGWLDSRHTFSFGEYHDAKHMHFRSLRVINDDRVAAAGGFDMHPHRDMEIMSYVVAGALEHRDSMGNGSVIRPGDVQVMSAGTGILHSEFNPSSTEPMRLLQIWILPDRKAHTPRYDQKSFPRAERINRVVTAVSGRSVGDTDEGALFIHRDASVHLVALEAGVVEYTLKEGRSFWLQLVSGSASVNGIELTEGDGASTSTAGPLRIASDGTADLILFDLD